MDLIYSFTVALFLTIALIPILIKYSAQLQLLDDPNNSRKVHQTAIPRSGGLAIAIGVFLPLVFMLPVGAEFKGLLSGAVIIVIFGILDDRFELNYKWKFLGQIVAVLAVMSAGILIHKVPFLGLNDAPLWVIYPLTFLFLLGVTNAVNLTDGLDGLAAGTTLLSLALITVFALKINYSPVALVSLTVIGGVLGFLRYNTFPARIFMGDTGSQFLGFTAATLAVLVSQVESAAYSPVIPLLILGLPILDTIMVMTIRLKERRSPFSPDQNHLHHQLIALGFRHYEAVALIYLAQIVLVLSAYLCCYESDAFLLVYYLLFCTIILSVLFFARRCQWRFRDEERAENIADRRNKILRKMDWVYNFSSHVIEALIVVILLVSSVLVSNIETDFTIAAAMLAIVLSVLWLCFRHAPVFATRAACYTASVFVVYLFSISELTENTRFVLDGLLFVLALFLMLSIRMTRREEFRLDTQDLLILLMIVIVPQFPFANMDQLSLGQVVLRLAVLMYACEFVLAKNRTSFRWLNAGAIASLVVLAAHGI